MTTPHPYLALFYDYVENMLERRTPHRDGHLALIAEWNADGRLKMAGPVGDPPSRGLLVFDLTDEEEVANFVHADPYMHAGLVTRWDVEPWSVVTDS